VLSELEEELFPYPCKFIKTQNTGLQLYCGPQPNSDLQITLFTKDGVLTFYSLRGNGEVQEVDVVTSFRLGAFNFAVIADDRDYLYLMLEPMPLPKGLHKHVVFDFGLDLNVREMFKTQSNHLVFTQAWVQTV
jgi:hypothetical protein